MLWCFDVPRQNLYCSLLLVRVVPQLRRSRIIAIFEVRCAFWRSSAPRRSVLARSLSGQCPASPDRCRRQTALEFAFTHAKVEGEARNEFLGTDDGRDDGVEEHSDYLTLLDAQEKYAQEKSGWCNLPFL